MSTSEPNVTQDCQEPAAAFSEFIRKFEERANEITEASTSATHTKEADEQALESHEVVELQAFIERKEWIEEKIAFLESLPLIEVFPDKKDITPSKTSATRAQWNDWLVEQDKIEKETEIFDSGDLKKLKKLTKAATQRNLSPEDTDLIEVTLSTLYALDKLFHLLRNRSELLELLGLRLSWEEIHLQASTTHSEILTDSRSFLNNRARWSPAIYFPYSEASSKGLKGETRSRGLSRSARFSLAESLSKEVTHISSRVSSLRIGHVNTSGKLLDKLIDESPGSVPDWMLDEQDNLEEKCVKELASIAKFLLNIVSQWKRADELYAETVKDCAALDELLSDMNRTRQEHPSRKVGNTFNTRLEALLRRISGRPDPVATSGFPAPVHPAFPDQGACNNGLAESLTSSLSDARKLATQTSDLLKQYTASCDMLDLVEVARTQCLESRSKLTTLACKLRDGVDSSDGDGSPPNLADKTCVDPLNSSLYLALLPSFLEEVSQSSQMASSLLQEAQKLSMCLNKPGIGTEYREIFIADVRSLEDSLDDLVRRAEEVTVTVQKLREVRRIWSIMVSLDGELRALATNLKDEIKKRCWTQQVGGEAMPPTPESLVPALSSDEYNSVSFEEQIKRLNVHFSDDIVVPLGDMKSALPELLWILLQEKQVSLEKLIRGIRAVDNLLSAVHRQALAMDAIREEAHRLENQIEDAKICYDEYYSSINTELQSTSLDTTVADKGLALSSSVDKISDTANDFLESLHSCVPFISSTSSSTSDGLTLANMQLLHLSTFDATATDRAVRNDSNAYAIRLSGAIKSLLHKRSLNDFYLTSRELTKHLGDAHTLLNSFEGKLEKASQRLAHVIEPESEDADSYISVTLLLEQVLPIEQLLSSAEALIARMRDHQVGRTDSSTVALLSARQGVFNEANAHLDSLRRKLEDYIMQVDRVNESRSSESMESGREVEADSEKVERGDDTVDDVFGPQISPRKSHEADDSKIITQIRSLRKRVKSLGLVGIVNTGTTPSTHSSASALPTSAIFQGLLVSFESIEAEASQLPPTLQVEVAETDLRSLRLELQFSQEQLNRIRQLSYLQSSIVLCDTAFSDFLDYLDSHEGPSQLPIQNASLSASVGDKLSERMAYTKGIFEDMMEQFYPVEDDPKAVIEYDRLKQTWEELTEMAMEKINGRLSRQGSVSALSSGRSSKASVRDEKKSKYGNLSVSSRDGFLDPPYIQRRAASSSSASSAGASNPIKDLSHRTRLSVSKSYSSRSVSGPATRPVQPRSLFSSTFASRQRTTSVSSTASAGFANIKSGISPATIKRRMSSALSESPRIGSPLMQTKPRGTWSRAPRQSLSSITGMATPENKRRSEPKKYVANPENKLDVALGDVINNLPVAINVEAVVDTWKDKSGKYWIGGDEPKLCFCRILRSQTVMIRVGGGWQELSKFIKTHFADLFRIMPESPECPETKERWISASTLRRGSEASLLTRSPGTPESLTPSLPSFALSTPDGTRTPTIQTPSPAGSPLTPLQFIRRADPVQTELSLSSLALSANPSKANAHSRSSIPRPRGPTTNSQAKIAWRP